MRRRLLPLAALVAVLSAAPAYGRVADHNPVETTDPAGDSRGAPDITGVTVANDLSGNILFVVEVRNRTGFVASDRVALFIDSDRDPRTGSPAKGADYRISIDAGMPAIALARWNGTAYDDVVATTLRFSWAAGYVALINRAELGNTTAFGFQVRTLLAGGDDADLAPDADFQTYSVAPPHIEAIAARFSTPTPRAGKTFRLHSVQLTFESGDTAGAATFACRATLAGKRIRGTGPGACTFNLPKTARGKKLVVTITATASGGKPETFAPYTFKVR